MESEAKIERKGNKRIQRPVLCMPSGYVHRLSVRRMLMKR